MDKLNSVQRLTTSMSHKKNTYMKDKKEDYIENDEAELQMSDGLLEQVSELYGKEYDFSVLSSEDLEKFLSYALNAYKQGDFSLLKTENLPLDLSIKLNSLPIITVEEKSKTAVSKSKTDKKENTLSWNKNFELPSSKYDKENIIIEADINMCSESAKIFIEKLFVSYINAAEKYKFKVRDIETSDKKFSFLIEGEGAFKVFKYEKGLHYIKDKEYNTNVFISTIPEMPEEDYAIKINPNDLKIETYRSGGAGGQHVNKTATAVRITHIPTNTVVVCQNERSQLMNKNIAIKLLAAKLNEIAQKEREQQQLTQRLSFSDTTKIRTYDLNNNTLTDHRIGYKVGIEQGMEKFDLTKVIDKLSNAENQLQIQNNISR